MVGLVSDELSSGHNVLLHGNRLCSAAVIANEGDARGVCVPHPPSVSVADTTNPSTTAAVAVASEGSTRWRCLHDIVARCTSLADNARL